MKDEILDLNLSVDSIGLELTWELRNNRWLGWLDLAWWILDMHTWYVTWFSDPMIDLDRVRVCDDLDRIEI